jgi:hypothetical protein
MASTMPTRRFLNTLNCTTTENADIRQSATKYLNSLVDYSYTQYKKDTEAGGYVTKYNELKQFFPRTGTNGSGNGSTTPPPEPE